MIGSIPTGRFDLILMTPAFLRASLEGKLSEAERELGLSLPTGWPGKATKVFSLRLNALEAERILQPWLLAGSRCKRPV